MLLDFQLYMHGSSRLNLHANHDDMLYVISSIMIYKFTAVQFFKDGIYMHQATGFTSLRTS